MIPARYRERVDIGTYWADSIIGTLVSLAFLNWIGPVLGRRLGFLVGPALAVVIRRPAGQDRPGYVACWN